MASSSTATAPASGVGEQPHVGVDERQDARRPTGGGGARGAGVRLAEPARRRRAGRRAAAPAGRAPRARRRRCRRSTRRRRRRPAGRRRRAGRAARPGSRRPAAASSRTGSDHRDRAPHRRRVGRRAAEQRDVQRRVQPRPATDSPASARTSRPLTGARCRRCWTSRATSTGTREAGTPGGRAGQARASRRARAPRRGSSSPAPAAARRRRSAARRRRRSGPRAGRAGVMSTSAGEQPAGQVGQRHRVDAGQPGLGVRPRPVAGLHHLRVQDDVPGGEDRRGHAMRTAARRPGAPARRAGRRAPSSARPSSARPAARGTARRAASGRGRRCTS